MLTEYDVDVDGIRAWNLINEFSAELLPQTSVITRPPTSYENFVVTVKVPNM